MAEHATGWIPQEELPGGTTLVDARNGFNELSRLEMMCTVHHRWTVGTHFTLNGYKHWAQLSREGAMQGDPVSMFLYGVTLITLADELCAAVPDLLAPFFADNASFGGPEDRRSRLRTLLLEWGPVRGYLPEPAKSLFICNSPAYEEAVKRSFVAEGLEVKVVP